jgi:hypothetical protein
MSDSKAGSGNIEGERIDVGYDDAVCAWARHFNTSQKRVKEAVQAVGDRADGVRDHLMASGSSDRPSAR